MSTKILYQDIIKCHKLTDFAGIREIVIANYIKKVPEVQPKKEEKQTGKNLMFFYQNHVNNSS